MIVRIDGDEWYPVWSVRPVQEGERTFEVDDETLARWKAAEDAFAQAQAEMHDLVSPRCPECNHRLIRHQEHSPRWEWGCLDWFTDDDGARTTRCRCRYGIPPERLVRLQAQWRA